MPLLYNWSHYLTVFRCLLEKIERAGLFYYFSIFFLMRRSTPGLAGSKQLWITWTNYEAYISGVIALLIKHTRSYFVPPSQPQLEIQLQTWIVFIKIFCYLFSSQSKSAHVIGFNWTNLNEIVFITNQGLEFYQVEASILLNKCRIPFSSSCKKITKI